MPTSPARPAPLPVLREGDEKSPLVVLRWAPVDGATRYRVQIAPTPGFHEAVFEYDVDGGVVALVVPSSVPVGGPVLYWRALASSARGWAREAPVQRLPAGPAETPHRLLSPADAEPFGPAVALLSTASLEAVAEVLPGHQTAIEGALGEDHPEGVEAAEIVTIELGLLIAAGVVLALLVVLIVGLSL